MYSSTAETIEADIFEAADGWVHFVGTHTDDANDYVEAFVDGEAHCSGECSVDVGPASSASKVSLGSDQIGGSLFDGQIYECFFFDRHMTPFEICEICRFGLDGQATDRSAQCGACDYTP
jgi:hypothetical protein